MTLKGLGDDNGSQEDGVWVVISLKMLEQRLPGDGGQSLPQAFLGFPR